ncbi:MAG: hypothetical protein ACP5H2_11165 [Solirubrobacteraceae bacterium]
MSVQKSGTSYIATTAPAATSASDTAGVQSDATAVPAGLSIPDGQIYASAENTLCASGACNHAAIQQTMIQNVPGAVYTGQSISSSVYNSGGTATSAQSYSEWPNSTGDQNVSYSPQGFTNSGSGGATASVGLNWGIFSFGYSFPIGSNASFGPWFPHGTSQPAFGGQWSGHGTGGSGLGSTDVVHIGAGQSDYCGLVQVAN